MDRTSISGRAATGNAVQGTRASLAAIGSDVQRTDETRLPEQLEQGSDLGANRGLERRLVFGRPFGRVRRRHGNAGLARFFELRAIDRADVQQRDRHAGRAVLREVLRRHLRGHLDDVLIAERGLQRTGQARDERRIVDDWRAEPPPAR